jgi:hypothetical protein
MACFFSITPKKRNSGCFQVYFGTERDVFSGNLGEAFRTSRDVDKADMVRWRTQALVEKGFVNIALPAEIDSESDLKYIAHSVACIHKMTERKDIIDFVMDSLEKMNFSMSFEEACSCHLVIDEALSLIGCADLKYNTFILVAEYYSCMRFVSWLPQPFRNENNRPWNW